ncbi:hypothetical protein CGCSCA1_v008470 [Colletotrichum siamense]|nr:hypothetical protein CGCSCA1_v008470 [Colletotrichum siamense]
MCPIHNIAELLWADILSLISSSIPYGDIVSRSPSLGPLSGRDCTSPPIFQAS